MNPHVTQTHPLSTRRAFAVLLVTALMGLAGTACATAPEGATESQIESVIAKEDWLKTVQDNLSSNLCADGQLFRSCFAISENECHDRVHEVASNCSIQYQGQLPDALNNRQGRRWGGQIGQCTGEGLYEVLDANYAFNESERCKQLMNEM